MFDHVSIGVRKI
jgi:catechol 2,3-dioxygenase-like lactoylglutathione lyase family enzyme